MHIPRGRRHCFFEKILFCLVLLYACFLVTLWCFELLLVSMLCCSHRIVFMCCIRMPLCFIDCMFGWSFALLYDHCTHFHMTVMCLIKLLICFTSCLLDRILLVFLSLDLPWGSNAFCASVSSYKYFVLSSSQVLNLGVSEFCHYFQTHV